MKRLIEIVPNFSEGRRKDVIDQITGVVENIEDAWLLDVEMDSDHNRTVVTVIVTPESLVDAGVQMLGKAIELIDLNNHEGQHPRMGACDVFPLIPLSGVTVEQAQELCIKLGDTFADKYSLPTYLYEDAALKPWRKNLARLRKSGPLEEGGEKVGAFEWLRVNMPEELNLRKPDFGPSEVHPTAGITAISTRFFLIAYNVNLETTDLSIAENIALKIRERSGGFSAVKALGFELKDKNCVQVSMNLVDYRKTGIETVFCAIEKLAKKQDVEVRESELIGLVPQNAIDSTVFSFLGIEDYEFGLTEEKELLPVLAYPIENLSQTTEKFSSKKDKQYQVFEFENIDVLADFAKIEGLKGGKILKPMSQEIINELFRRLIKLPELLPTQIIENNVKEVTGIIIPTMKPENPHKMLRPYFEILASEAPTPGGGSISALAGALAAALGEMVGNLTRSKKKYLENWSASVEIVRKLNELREEAFDLMAEDAQAYELVAAAMKLPKKTDEELAVRAKEYQKALKEAIKTPMRCSKVAVEIAENLSRLLEVGAPSAITDIGVGALLSRAAFEGAVFNSRINMLDLEDKDYKEMLTKQIEVLREKLNSTIEDVLIKVNQTFNEE